MEQVLDRRSVKRLILFSAISLTSIMLIMLAFRSLLIPILLSLFFSYILFPVLKFLERRFAISRLFAVWIVLHALLAILAGAIAGLIPIIRYEVVAIARMLPQAKVALLEKWLPWVKEYLDRFGLSDSLEVKRLLSEFKFSNQFGTTAHTIQNIMDQTSGLLGGIIIFLLIPVFSFFILKEYENIVRFFRSLVPPDILSPVSSFFSQVDATLKSVLKRQVTVAFILAALYSVGFSIVGLKYSLAIGVISGVCRLVPYLDVAVAIALSLLVIISDPAQGWMVLLGVIIVIAIVQGFDGALITPKVIGDKVGLHPAVVIASVIAFGDWFGFAGVLIAIPAAALIKIVLVASLSAYRNSLFYEGV